MALFIWEIFYQVYYNACNIYLGIWSFWTRFTERDSCL